MTNIQDVRLENFQSHLDTFVEFSKGLNVLVGQSDSGKTAILRGIRWALYNQPRGTDFIRVGADFVRVTVSFDNETVIIRERTNSKNRYTIRKAGGDELVLEGFGIHVPEEVLEAHGMGHLRIDHDNDLMIHLSQQLDGPFLLEQTSSIRAKTLGRISGAHFLDMAIRDMTKDLSQLNQRLKQEQQAIDRLQEQLIPYASLDVMKEQLDDTEKRIQQAKQLEEQKNKLLAMKQQKERVETEEEKTKKRRLLVQGVDDWSNQVEQLHAMVSRFVTYEQRRKQYRDIEKAMAICHEWLEKTQDVQVASQGYERSIENVTRHSKLKGLLLQQESMQRARQQEQKQMQWSSFVDSINLASLEKIAQKQETYQKLTEIQEQMKVYSTQHLKTREFADRLPPINETVQKQEAIEDALRRLTRLQAIQSQLEEFEKRVSEGKQFIQAQAVEQEKAELEWQERLLAEGSCPTCGQSICKHEGG